jgi:HEAT repeat protein
MAELTEIFLNPRLIRSSHSAIGDNAVLRAEALTTAGTRAIVVGPAGSGKTTLLRYLAYRTATEGLWFPVYTPLRNLDLTLQFPISAFKSALQMLGAADEDPLRAEFDAALREGRAALFLDGADEIEDLSRHRLFRLLESFTATVNPRNIVVISTRYSDRIEALSNFSVYQIAPLQANEASQLIRKLADNTESLKLERLLLQNTALRQIAETPFGINLLLRVASSKSDDLLHQPLKWYAEIVWRSAHPFSDEVQAMLQEIARDLTFGESVPRGGTASTFSIDEVNAVARRIYHGSLRATQATTALLNSLAIYKESSTDFSFAHRTIQEFFAARAVASDPKPLVSICNLAFTHLPVALEPLAMTFGMIESADEVFTLLRDLPDSTDLLLFSLRARALRYLEDGTLSPSNLKRFVSDLLELASDSNARSVAFLQRIGSLLNGVGDRTSSLLAEEAGNLLLHHDAEVRKRIVIILGAMQGVATLEPLSRALRDPNRDVREYAATALGETGRADAIPILRIAYLTDEGNLVLGEAADAIARIGGTQAISCLVEILRDVHLFRNLRWPAARALGAIGDPTVFEPLVAVLADESELLRENAVRALGDLRDNRALPYLVSLLRDPEGGVRMSAADALGKLSAVEAATALCQALREDPHSAVREYAAQALFQVDREALQQELTALVRKPDGSWRGDAARWLGQCAGDSALSLLHLFARDPDETLRAGVAEGLAFVEDESANGILVRLLADRHADVRVKAIASLGRRQYAPAISMIAQSLRPGEAEQIRVQAAISLGDIGDPSAVDPLIQALEHVSAAAFFAATSLGRLRDPRAIDPLFSFCRELRAEQTWPISAIARIGGPTASRSLTGMLSFTEPLVRRLAAAYLSETNCQEAVIGLLKGTADEDQFVRVNSAIGLSELSRPILEEGLRLALMDIDSRVRGAAIKIIPFYADLSIEEVLARIAKSDPESQIRVTAADSLAVCDRKNRLCGNGRRYNNKMSGEEL